MTEIIEKGKRELPATAELQEKMAGEDLESLRIIAEEALKKVAELSAENAKLQEKLKAIDKIFSRYEHLDGYMEKYGYNTELEREMWRTIRRITKG